MKTGESTSLLRGDWGRGAPKRVRVHRLKFQGAIYSSRRGGTRPEISGRFPRVTVASITYSHFCATCVHSVSSDMAQRVRNFVFTYNNPEDTPSSFSEKLNVLKPTYWVFQLERGEQGTPHFQGYVEMKNARTYSSVKAKLGQSIHLEGRKGTAMEAANYCKKEDTREAGPWEFGEITAQGTRTDLTSALSLAYDQGLYVALEAYPETFVRYYAGIAKVTNARLARLPREPLKVYLLYGPSGTGKTTWAQSHDPDTAKCDNIADGWFDPYNGEKHMLLDEFTGASSKISLARFLTAIDKHKTLVAVKNGFAAVRAEHIYITTNIHPREWYNYEGRMSQYFGIKRRVDQLVIWPRSEHKSYTFSAGTEAFDAFFDGPRAHGATSRNQEDDEYYTFMERFCIDQ